jgi:hypothetical protein
MVLNNFLLTFKLFLLGIGRPCFLGVDLLHLSGRWDLGAWEKVEFKI